MPVSSRFYAGFLLVSMPLVSRFNASRFSFLCLSHLVFMPVSSVRPSNLCHCSQSYHCSPSLSVHSPSVIAHNLCHCSQSISLPTISAIQSLSLLTISVLAYLLCHTISVIAYHLCHCLQYMFVHPPYVIAYNLCHCLQYMTKNQIRVLDSKYTLVIQADSQKGGFKYKKQERSN
ncbi:hypothetical protein PPL_12262 [Heterostelium album PN500]|uniref:Uncharacterized protein n=1 Tax=Heterostelium pallidum (strain ATCC 26659 / Pp 5 / PN500) TaxID=670386 RepID=D3BM53_HETP5|nr:hypothetical protein PPL_12262 [Heterostelium album PN500]EFA77654.1 hypothetical protein PPL_12262 [Heterostelium album PN500]|eukprot:XP_020429782.1 hypothetical protein PPL_12262 [Heterostelium album PN500]